MSTLRRYHRRPDQAITAIQLALESDGLRYHKWGAEQFAAPGDWLVDNNGDIYTVAADVFARTYRQVSPGRFIKATPVWARRATRPGALPTREGESHFAAGDYLVFNQPDATDGYCMTAEQFHALYEPDETD
ncbi:hypothetical protein [Sedimenticola thiotaurini]|uniref:Uncharacterized protein n=1 Tax=Sedimenticola thiotaurini TaxID=1543721 RepID=A0A0F7JWW5_9GAMM|nr:hypothetical protein [Sedimenticola thiotaurini]AKH21031.1 hypothetical protein AAY24_12470 [Sedimenticola thiotaurini]